MKKAAALTALLLVFVAASTVAVVIFRDSGGEGGKLSPPLDEGSLNVQVGTDKSVYRYGDKVKFSSSIENKAADSKTYTFNSTCTQGTLWVDGKKTQQIQACGAAITEVPLRPKEKLTYEYEFKLAKEFSQQLRGDYVEYDGELVLAPGRHEAYVEWKDVRSKTTTFEVAR